MPLPDARAALLGLASALRSTQRASCFRSQSETHSAHREWQPRPSPRRSSRSRSNIPASSATLSAGAKCPAKSGSYLPSSNSLLGLLFDPLLDMRLQHAERQRAILEHHIVKASKVKLRTVFLLGYRAQFANLQLANLVRECLP